MLKTYREKRDFTKTKEPSENGDAGDGALTYVIQEHHATHLHWDLRLECDGVLKSWAVPKGPSPNPQDKRLAVMVEDHPLAYGQFEGTIPKGQYGGGEVKIWDHGIYTPDEPHPVWDDRAEAERLMRAGLEKGKLSFTLKGERLRGSWALVRIAKSPENWLLLKHRDEFAEDAPPDLELIEPMLATEVSNPFDDEDWAFEPKLDGIRVAAYKSGDQVSLVSRGGIQIATRFPRIASEIRNLPVKELILDGEIVAFDEEGKPDFEKVMDQYNAPAGHAEGVYYVFDLLRQDGEDQSKKSYSLRRSALLELGLSGRHLKAVESFATEGTALFEHAVKLGFEGVIAKRLDRSYQPGRRSDDWRKIKRYHTDDFYVGGWLEGKGHRSKNFGALLLGSLDDGKLVYRGNVGGGFSDHDLKSISVQLEKRATSESPFEDSPKLPGAAHWVEPTLAAEVRYMSVTKSNRLRFPTFNKMRTSVEKQSPPAALTAGEIRIVDDLRNADDNLALQIGKHHLGLTNLNKELWPKSEFGPAVTKRDLLIHYARFGSLILPHLKDRPLAFVRYPSGLDGPHFFQKHVPEKGPDFLRTVDVFSGSNSKDVAYLIVNDLATLLWLAQMGALELHPWQSRITPGKEAGATFETEEGLAASVLDRPDFMVLDLDPYTYSGSEAQGAEPELNRKGWDQAVEVALRLNESLDQIGMSSFLKTSGKTGLHIYVPLDRKATYAEARAVAKTIGEHLMKQHPDLITMEWSVKKRPAKVYFDAGQNVMGKTLAGIYSTRPTPGALVSFPLQWEQLKDVYPTDFTIATVPGLIQGQGDLWADISKKLNTLPGVNP